ncbi:MAG: phage tail protein [Hyphomicrobiales bacterium]|nr:phage tail protein [Hyphomicrobiales bacterium]MDE2113813.1 phage tail protein [Hyphomicrobiales bacterium]
MGVLMAWGPYIFETLGTSLDEIEHDGGGRWAEHEIIGRRPASQFLGPDMEKVTLKGCSWPWLAGGGPAAQVAAMRAEAEAGSQFPLLSMSGDVAGLFHLKSISSTGQHLDAGGNAQKLGYTLHFRRSSEGAGAIFNAWP